MAPAMIASAGRCVAVVYSATIAIMSMLGSTVTMGSALGNQPTDTVLEGFRPQHLRGLNICDQGKACSHLMSALTTDSIMSLELSHSVKLFHCVGQRNRMKIKGFRSTSENSNETEAWISYKVQLTCISDASVESMIFSARILSDDTPIMGRMNNIVTNWMFKPITCTQDKIQDSPVLLMRPQLHTPETLNLNFTITWVASSNINLKLAAESKATTSLRFLEYAMFDCMSEQLYQERLQLIKLVNHGHFPVKSLKKRAITEGVSGYLIVANRLYIHHISLDGSRMNVAVSGLKYAVAVDFHFRTNSLYWTDSSRRAIMKSTLDGTKLNILLDHGLTQPESLAIDWISNKLYWTDVGERVIGVLDLISFNYKHSLISTETSVSPRGLVVDPVMRILYWTEWGRTSARIRKASMDGQNTAVLFQDDLRRPYGIAMDYDNQILCWTDSYFDKIECGNVDGTGRRMVVSSGLEEPFDLTLLGDTLYISDWNLGILATNQSGGQPLRTVYDTFCDGIQTFGVQVVAEQRQLLAVNPCDDDSERRCSHLCVLSSVNSSGFSCLCPDGMTLDVDGLTCSQTSDTNVTVSTVMGSCRMAGYESCCTSGVCNGSLSLCYCDSDCYHFGDCCNDIENTCSSAQTQRNAYLLISNVFYIHRISLDGVRMKTLDASRDMIKAIDYNYWTNHIYWSTSNRNILWQSQLDGSVVTPLLTDNLQTIDDIAVDWISNKLYWTDNGQISRIGVLDIASGYYTSIINTGAGTNPRAIVVDPIHRVLYWSDWGSVAKIEKASMNGKNRTVIIDTGLVWPSGLTIDHAQQVLYWTDNSYSRRRIERSNIDGSNRRTISDQRIYQPFGISVYRSTLYYTDFISGVNTLNISGESLPKTIVNSLCEDAIGIEVFNIERQPAGTNPCQMANGGCSHICLLSSVEISGFSCACPDDLTLDVDAQTCISTSTQDTVTQNPLTGQGTCAAAGYTGGCCTSGICRGLPPTCSCDSTCHVFRDCCSDVPPSCQPAVDVLEFVQVPSNVTTILDGRQQLGQFHCSVRASRVTNFQWRYTAVNHGLLSSSIHGDSNSQQISNQVGSLDTRYSVVSSDYSSELIITNVSFSDAGIYTCIASIGDTVSLIESSAFHTVEVLPKVTDMTGNYSFSNEETLHVWCRVEAYPQPSLAWIIRKFKTIRRILPTTRASVGSTFFIIDSGNPYLRSELTIDNVNSDDSGEYICAATADIRYSLVRSGSHPVTIISTNECEKSHSPCLNGGTCINDNGRYQCVCSSDYSGRNCSQRIEPFSKLVKPFLTSTPTSKVIVELGNSTNLTCEAAGYPTPTFQWYKDGVPIWGENEPSLFISEVLPGDRGNYSCKATNSQGAVESGQTQLLIPRIFQYAPTLKCNGTLNINDSHEILTLIADSSFLNGHGIIYSIEHLEDHTNLSTSHLLLTLLTMDNMPLYDIVRKLLTSELMEICSVLSLNRFDGCEISSHSELDIGELIDVPCPCHEYVWMLPDVGNQRARINCGGSYASGPELMDTDFSQCITVTDSTTSSLCQVAMSLQGTHEYPSELVESVLNTTSEQQLTSMVDISLLAVIVELLTNEAITNPKIRDGYLKVIDYFQMLDPHQLRKLQSSTNSSTRVLKSLEQFASAVIIANTNGSNMATSWGYQSYGISLVDIDTVTITNGQTFSARRRKISTTSVTEWTLAIVAGKDNLSESLVTLELPNQFLNECFSADGSPGVIRVAYFVFSGSSLFQSPSNEEQLIGSVIISAQINCSYDQISSPIAITYDTSAEEDMQRQSCVSTSISQGLWLTTHCQQSLESSSDLIKCSCYELPYFGLLPEPLSIDIVVLVYIAVVFSSFVLIFTIITIIEARLIKLISIAEVVVLFHVDLILIFNYFFFLLGANFTTIPILCGINSGVLQLITLVFYCWLATQAVLWYLKYYQHSKKQSLMCMAVLSWILPLVVVGLTAAIWYESYVDTYFCGVTDWPLLLGLTLPLAFIGSIHFVIIILHFYKLIIKSSRIRSATQSSSPMKSYPKTIKVIILTAAVFFTFYSGAIFQLLSVNRRLNHYSKHFQVVYSVLAIIQGPLFFAHVLYCSVRDIKQLSTYKFFCCAYITRSAHLSGESYHTSESTNTTKASINSLSQAESTTKASINSSDIFKTNNVSGEVVPTMNANPAYERHVIQWRKNEFAMKKNDVYETVTML